MERKLLVISEAAVRLGQDALLSAPVVPWHKIRGMGNWIRHQYDRVDLETVWNTVKDDLPALKAAVQQALDAADSKTPT